MNLEFADTRIIFYVGCFKPLTPINATPFRKLSECEHTCDKHAFYGVNSVNDNEDVFFNQSSIIK